METRPGRAQTKLDLRGLKVIEQKIEYLEQQIAALLHAPEANPKNIALLKKARLTLRTSKAEIPKIKVLIEDRLGEP